MYLVGLLIYYKMIHGPYIITVSKSFLKNASVKVTVDIGKLVPVISKLLDQVDEIWKRRSQRTSLSDCYSLSKQ